MLLRPALAASARREVPRPPVGPGQGVQRVGACQRVRLGPVSPHDPPQAISQPDQRVRRRKRIPGCARRRAAARPAAATSTAKATRSARPGGAGWRSNSAARRPSRSCCTARQHCSHSSRCSSQRRAAVGSKAPARNAPNSRSCLSWPSMTHPRPSQRLGQPARAAVNPHMTGTRWARPAIPNPRMHWSCNGAAGILTPRCQLPRADRRCGRGVCAGFGVKQRPSRGCQRGLLVRSRDGLSAMWGSSSGGVPDGCDDKFKGPASGPGRVSAG